MRPYRELGLISGAILVFWFVGLLIASKSVWGQTRQDPAPSPEAVPLRQNDAAAQDQAPRIDPSLQCPACHGPGKTLPFLAGDLFHRDAHSAYDQGQHNRAIQSGRKGAACLDCHSVAGEMSTILPASDPKSTINRANVAVTCGKCHGDRSVVGQGGISDRPFISYQESVHARALARGNLRAAVCTDCHRSHDILTGSDAKSPIFKFNVPQTCGQCHASEMAAFNESVHGHSILRGNSQSPVCTDCHGIHEIKPRTDSRAALRMNTCARCHEGVRLTQEFGVPEGRVSSYEESYHGMAARLGSSVAADCASCHGVHDILPSTDAKSLINPANLVQTCGQCHPGASRNFAIGKVHLNVPVSQDAGSIGVRWVRRIYLSLIVIVVGGMLVHNLLAWRKKALVRRRLELRTLLRLTTGQRVQHWLLLSSFIVLVLTGFALAYPESWLAYLVLGITEPTRRLVHRAAAVILMIVGIYHPFYLALTQEGRAWVKDMRPTITDFRDVLQNLAYYLGLKSKKPPFARFGYPEKAEYWAVIWGTIIMGLTGMMIWFKIRWFGFLPRWMIDIALAVHFYEAVLATLAIVVWHFYHVIFDPSVYPVNWAFVDGRVSEELYQEEHELDYQKLKAKERMENSQAAVPDASTEDGVT